MDNHIAIFPMHAQVLILVQLRFVLDLSGGLGKGGQVGGLGPGCQAASLHYQARW